MLHTSSNAPAIIFIVPGDFITSALLLHMAVVLASMYDRAFLFRTTTSCQVVERDPNLDRASFQ